MNNGVEGLLSTTADAAHDSGADITSSSGSGSEGRIVRRRRRHHGRHQNLSRGSGRTKEIVFVTVVALAILFGVLYYLLPRYSLLPHEESRVVPIGKGVAVLAHLS